MFLLSPFYKRGEGLRWNSIKCIVSLIGVIFFGYVLIKIYEVPVYYTKIDTVLINSTKHENDTLNIKILRNYDRPDKSTILEDASDSITSLWINNGGIFLTGSYHYENGNLTGGKKTRDSITNVIKNVMRENGKKKIKNPQYVYISALTSYRQIFGIHKYEQKKASCSIDNETWMFYSWKGGKIVTKDRSYKDYFWYKNYKSHYKHNGYVLEEYYAASEKDSVLYIDYFANPISCSKPDILLTAEDISKIVEVIEIGHSDREHVKESDTWADLDRLEVDYVGPAEFSEHIIPEPDTLTLSSIIYTNKEKIKQIGKNGLRYHVRFPDMENIQEARIFILSGLVTGLSALFLRYLFYLLQNIYQHYRDKIKRWHYYALVLIILILIIVLCFVYDSANVSSFDIQNEMMQKS